jgi:hypothetical protein
MSVTLPSLPVATKTGAVKGLPALTPGVTATVLLPPPWPTVLTVSTT